MATATPNTGGTRQPALGLVIKGLCPGLPEVGKIKIGMKGRMITSRGGAKFQPPQKLDHFRVTTLQRGEDGNYLVDRDIHETIGARPNRIKVRLLYDDPELNFPTRLTCYNGARLWCAGNNEVAMRLNGDGRTRSEVSCPCERIDPCFEGRGKCKYNGVLSVILEDHQRVGGVWKFRTTSYNSVVNILSSMAMIQRITGGKLAGIPLDLTVLPKTVPTPGTGQVQTVYVVGLEYRGSMLQLAEEGARHAIAMAEQHEKIRNVEKYVKQSLLAYDRMDTDPDDDIIDEFYPEERTGAGDPRPSGQEKKPPADPGPAPDKPNYGGGLVENAGSELDPGASNGVEKPETSRGDQRSAGMNPAYNRPSEEHEQAMKQKYYAPEQLYDNLYRALVKAGIKQQSILNNCRRYVRVAADATDSTVQEVLNDATADIDPFLRGFNAWMAGREDQAASKDELWKQLEQKLDAAGITEPATLSDCNEYVYVISESTGVPIEKALSDAVKDLKRFLLNMNKWRAGKDNGGGQGSKDLGAIGTGMNKNQLWEMLKNKAKDAGIKEPSSWAKVVKYIDHNIKMTGQPEEEVLRAALNTQMADFIRALADFWNSAYADGDDKEDTGAGGDDPDAGEPPLFTVNHPWFRSNWIGQRKGNGKTTGFKVHVMKNLDTFAEAPEEIRSEAKAKYARTYKEPWPGDTVSDAGQGHGAGDPGGSDPDHELMLDEVLGLRSSDANRFGKVCADLGLKTTFPHKMSDKELMSVIDEFNKF